MILFLKMLITCDCHLNSSSMVISRTLCSITCTTALKLRSKTKRRSLVFLTGSYEMHLVGGGGGGGVQGVNTLDKILHQSDTSLRLFCNVTSMSFTVFPLVSRDESSANRVSDFFYRVYAVVDHL